MVGLHMSIKAKHQQNPTKHNTYRTNKGRLKILNAIIHTRRTTIQIEWHKKRGPVPRPSGVMN
jgi:hypothetical protein